MVEHRKKQPIEQVSLKPDYENGYISNSFDERLNFIRQIKNSDLDLVTKFENIKELFGAIFDSISLIGTIVTLNDGSRSFYETSLSLRDILDDMCPHGDLNHLYPKTLNIDCFFNEQSEFTIKTTIDVTQECFLDSNNAAFLEPKNNVETQENDHSNHFI